MKKDTINSDALKKWIAEEGESISFQKDEPLYMDGMKADRLFLIQSGNVRLNKLTSEGRELTLQICQPGDLIGELALYTGQLNFSANAWAVDKVKATFVKQAHLEETLTSDAILATQFMKFMGENFRKNQSKFRDLLLHGKKGALYSTLIRLSNTYGVKKNDDILIDIPLTNQELGNFCGLTRESVNRILSELKKANIVSVKQGIITIHNLEFLRCAIHCEDCPITICRL
ncbi:Crp/Fnr family transcriptional regulator [Bacillus sp. es.036]|uniref:Crp/Fnr family transcriptional regulator n=1 Tax=Bacillus sp. es.036 TaxID=1761764 RepID=UPI000BF4C1F0|nr:Crp/Fnr family transcriptional regulator [Bacillus sp. es.036]PFG12667.1 CRP/FNR family transcriptional regulator [Bacillus sp. es.036]